MLLTITDSRFSLPGSHGLPEQELLQPVASCILSALQANLVLEKQKGEMLVQ